MDNLFDRWANEYMQSVHASDTEGTYPFAGYETIRTLVLKTLEAPRFKRVLDMGVGTGAVTSSLHEMGKEVVGVDSSRNMLEKAEKAMKKASFIHADFFSALEGTIGAFDAVIFNYSIHHLSPAAQKALVLQIHDHLQPEGVILIGDVMRRTRAEIDSLKGEYIDIWDEEEHYPVYDELVDDRLSGLFDPTLVEVSHCAGVIRLVKRR